jgi:tRNA-(ms[2]io[6]A)-hydroxylase
MTTQILPWSSSLQGLPLLRETHPDWIAVARADLRALLVDHAHCEQKAASQALSLIGRFPEDGELVRSMVGLAAEEMRHFRRVLDWIDRRGESLTRPAPDPYVQELRSWSFRRPGGLGARVDLLLACAFVEARSCERFRILAGSLLPEEGELRELGGFYLRLADAESRHWETFRNHALRHGPEEAVAARICAMADAEAKVVSRLPVEPRMH